MLPLFFSGLLLYLVGTKSRTSKCFPCKRGNSHFLHYLKPINNAFRRFSLFTEKNLFMEGANSFLEELLPFGKRLKTREAKSCFQQNSLDHRLSNRCWVYTSMIPNGYALIAVVLISTLHYWTFSLSLIDLGLIMGSQLIIQATIITPSCENIHVHVLGKQIYAS